MTTTSILTLILSVLSFLGSLVALWIGASNRRRRDDSAGFSAALLDAKRALSDAQDVPYAQAHGAALAAAIAGRLNVRVTNPPA